MSKLVLEVGDVGQRLVIGMVVAFNQVLADLGETITVDVLQEAKVRSRLVQYRAIGDRTALEALGTTTVEGIIFAHLLDVGPCTARAIQEQRKFRAKAVESSIFRLRHMGLVQSEEVARS